MNLRWNLDDLYTSFTSDKFQSDFKKCEKKIEEITGWVDKNLNNNENAASKIEEFMQLLIDFEQVFTLLNTYSYLRLSVNAKDDEALKNIEQLDEMETRLTKPYVTLQKWLGSLSKLDAIISSSVELKEYKFFLTELAENSKYRLSEAEEVLISKMTMTGGKAWSTLQQVLTATLMVKVEIDGEKQELPLSVVRNLAYEKDAATRKTAYQAELESYQKVEDSVAACLNGIKGEVITVTKMRGYQSPLGKTLTDSRMDSKTLEAMLKAMEESLPVFHRYYREKARLLGHKNGLPFYDLFAPMGKVNRQYSYQQAREFIVNNFRSFSDKLADFVDRAFAEEWIDAEPREGKTGGAFCSNIHPIKQSRVLTNFTGSFSDVTTLAHELGHAYHGECLTQESIINSDYPMPLAETASIFNETIITNAALRKADEEEAFAILESTISDAGQVIVDIYSRFLFESEVFDRRKESSLSVKELKEIMLNAQKKAYGDGLDHNQLHPYMWICKPHYYSPELSFYNFPYAFGLLFGKGLYAEYLKRGEEFVKEYDNLLSVTGKNKAADVTRMMNIDIQSVNFWRSSLKLIEKDIEEFIEISSAIK